MEFCFIFTCHFDFAYAFSSCNLHFPPAIPFRFPFLVLSTLYLPYTINVPSFYSSSDNQDGHTLHPYVLFLKPILFEMEKSICCLLITWFEQRRARRIGILLRSHLLTMYHTHPHTHPHWYILVLHTHEQSQKFGLKSPGGIFPKTEWWPPRFTLSLLLLLISQWRDNCSCFSARNLPWYTLNLKEPVFNWWCQIRILVYTQSYMYWKVNNSYNLNNLYLPI